jgi:hypothetical protein
MARAHGKPTAPAKRQQAGAPAAAPGKPARRAGGEPTPSRVPRSTQRSALAEHPAEAPEAAPRRRARRAPEAAVTPHRPRRVLAGESPLAVSVAVGPAGELHPSVRADRSPEAEARVMELNWGEDTPSSRRSEGLVQRWVKRGDALLRHLAEHGAARHEYRADLRDRRFVWVDAEGCVSAEAQAQVLCSWSPTTSALAMAWADPLLKAAGIARIDGLPAERDDVDEECAWRVAMEAADHAHAAYLYRVTTPHAWYFLALGDLTFHPERASFSPGTPVGLVLRGIAETRRAVESRAEPVEVVRDRLAGLGQALLIEAEYAYRNTDWVARLERAGKRLVNLGTELPRRSFASVAAGRVVGEWLDRQATIDLSDALALLEDEWAAFG